jgi:hypothetical protein
LLVQIVFREEIEDRASVRVHDLIVFSIATNGNQIPDLLEMGIDPSQRVRCIKPSDIGNGWTPLRV